MRCGRGWVLVMRPRLAYHFDSVQDRKDGTSDFANTVTYPAWFLLRVALRGRDPGSSRSPGVTSRDISSRCRTVAAAGGEAVRPMAQVPPEQRLMENPEAATQIRLRSHETVYRVGFVPEGVRPAEPRTLRTPGR